MARIWVAIQGEKVKSAYILKQVLVSQVSATKTIVRTAQCICWFMSPFFCLYKTLLIQHHQLLLFFFEGMHQTLFKYQSSRYKNSFRRRKKPHMSSNCFIDRAFRQSVSIYVQVSPFMDHHCRRETCQRRLDLLDDVSILTHTWPLQAWHHIPPAITSTWIIYHFVFLVEFFTGCLASFLWEYRSTWSARRSLVSQPTENMGQLCKARLVPKNFHPKIFTSHLNTCMKH